jgi:glycerol-3-phosphate acyltransferase PlsY
MQGSMNILVALVAAYLVGSISFAVVFSRVMGLADPRSYGSKNPGATNVLRSGNKAAALLTLAFDALKGYVPVLLVLMMGPRYGLGETTAAFAGLAAFVGHLWPAFFRFKGGKGVATAAGVIMAVNPGLGLCTLVSFGLIVAFSRYVSLASIVAAVFAPFYQALIWGVEPGILALIVMSLLLIWRHEGNIKKLLAGTENKLGQKPVEPVVHVGEHAPVHEHKHTHKHGNPSNAAHHAPHGASAKHKKGHS